MPGAIWRRILLPILTIPWTLRDGVGTFVSRRFTQVALLAGFLLGAFILLTIGLPILVLLTIVYALLHVMTSVLRLLVSVWRWGQFRLFRLQPDPDPFARSAAESLPPLPGVVAAFDHGRVFGPYNPDGLYDGVFEGGGVKAIAQIGAFHRMEQLGMRPERLVGTSGGAIVAAGVAVGGRAEDLWNVLARADLTALFDARRLPNVTAWRSSFYGLTPLVVPFVGSWGLMRGDAFLLFMRQGLASIPGPFKGNGDVTFGDIDAEWRRDLERRGLPLPATGTHRLTVIATDVTRAQPLVLPDGIAEYCLDPRGLCDECRGGGACVTPETLDLARAVRMSMSIPFLFEPFQLRLKLRREDGGVRDGGRCHIVDGGVSSNYPIWILDTGKGVPPRYPTFGFLLDEGRDAEGMRKASEVRPVRWLGGLAMAVVSAGIGVIDRVQSQHNLARTICIPTLGVATADFQLTRQVQVALHASGVAAADRFFAGSGDTPPFEWSTYVGDHRGGKARPLHPQMTARPASEHDGVEYVGFGKDPQISAGEA